VHDSTVEERERVSRSVGEEREGESKVAEFVLLIFLLNRCHRIIGLKYQLMLAELIFPK
jgi:hypothetical protein